MTRSTCCCGGTRLTCATPIIMGALMGFYARNGLDVEVVVNTLPRSRSLAGRRAWTAAG